MSGVRDERTRVTDVCPCPNLNSCPDSEVMTRVILEVIWAAKYIEPKGHFRTFFRKKFLSIMNGQFHVDPEILSPWVKRGQEVIWSEHNPNHDS